ncbi:hypothetical protein HDU93_002462, partial [Gonapodya sp. JEL0774]
LHPTPRYRSPLKLELILRAAMAAWRAVLCWEVADAVVKGGLGQAVHVSHLSADPTGCIASGIAMRGWPYYQSLALLELSTLVTSPRRRLAIYNDIDRQPTGWKKLCDSLLVVVERWTERVEREASGITQPTPDPTLAPPPTALTSPLTQLAGSLPVSPRPTLGYAPAAGYTPIPVKTALTSDILSPRKPSTLDTILLASQTKTKPDTAPSAPPVLETPAFAPFAAASTAVFSALPASIASTSMSLSSAPAADTYASPRSPSSFAFPFNPSEAPPTIPALLRPANDLSSTTTPLRRRPISSTTTPAPPPAPTSPLATLSPRIAKLAETASRDPAAVVEGIPWGRWLVNAARRWRARQVVAGGQGVGWAVESLSLLASQSITEDPWGTVQQDVPRILTALVRCGDAVDAYGRVVGSGVGEDDGLEVLGVEGKEVGGAVKLAIYSIVTAFWDHLSVLKLDERTRIAVKAYGEFRV